MIRDAAVLSLNELVLKPRGWQTFNVAVDESDVAASAPDDPGVYLLALPRHYLSYPGGYSRVLYIGRAVTDLGLRRRLGEHVRLTEQRRTAQGDTGRQYSRYEWSAVHGLVLTWSAAPGGARAAAKSVENDLLYWFAELYGAAPLGNAQAAWAESGLAPSPSLPSSAPSSSSP